MKKETTRVLRVSMDRRLGGWPEILAEIEIFSVALVVSVCSTWNAVEKSEMETLGS